MAEQFGEKVHEATEHRLHEAQKEGQVPKSSDLSSAIVLVIATGLLLFAGESGIQAVAPYLTEHLGGEAWVATNSEQVLNHWVRLVWIVLWVTVPVSLILAVSSIASQISQTGFLFLPKKLSPDWNRVDPIAGFGRLFSLQSAARVSFGLFKILLVIIVAGASLWGESEEFLDMIGWTVPEIGVYTVQTVLGTSFKVAIALLILALADYGFQFWKTHQDLRMTEQEVREELKHLIGDPQIIRRRRQVQQQMARSRITNNVRHADAIITNPTELAIAIKYDPAKMPAPIVVAKGAGTMAQRIRRLALEHHIPIVERKELAQALYRDVDINQEVPVDQYNAVAEVLRYVYQLQGKSLPKMPQRKAG
ncbi:MAG: EscU/YscU/HrcU family type III secretion system export apparatus switch protein [Planctomycetaceae bacterium]|jgi:flagellar biosynthesis protein FlhB|nr:EscU/YscU/HrcU family type III secretion system export apparatus switch protein [Planctomycetaceae bacterium]